MNTKTKLTIEQYQTELQKFKNRTLDLDNEFKDKENELNKLKKNFQEINALPEKVNGALKEKEEQFKLLQYEYEENIIEVCLSLLN